MKNENKKTVYQTATGDILGILEIASHSLTGQQFGALQCSIGVSLLATAIPTLALTTDKPLDAVMAYALKKVEADAQNLYAKLISEVEKGNHQ